MSGLSANFVDLAVIGVMLISALLAFGRGLVREVLSIGAWVAAALAALWGFPYAKDIARKYISITILADMVTATAIFLVTLIVCAAISHAIARNVRGSTFGALDRSLGLLFGLLRGAVLICFAYLLFTWAVPNEADQPTVIKEARSRPLIASGADILRSLLPQGALDRGAAAAADVQRQLEEQTKQQMLKGIDQPAPKPAAAPKQDPGYNANERKDLDRLIQGNQ
ncbi:MAG TPA: CvpA family protein [Verrucomicrobiae bacterium]|nr:CvpA family protein [Verrucomicrobiae bacterium]